MLGREQCSRRSIARAAVDNAIFTYFATVGRDIEGTRAQLVGERERRLAEVRALHGQAVQEARRVAAQLARIKRDYRDGSLPASDWIDFRDELTAEIDAACAEAERLAASQAEIEGDTEPFDAEHARHARRLRKAIAGEVKSSEGVDAVRAALARLFEAFIVRPQTGRVTRGRDAQSSWT